MLVEGKVGKTYEHGCNHTCMWFYYFFVIGLKHSLSVSINFIFNCYKKNSYKLGSTSKLWQIELNLVNPSH